MIELHKPVQRRIRIVGHGRYSVEICAAGIRYRAYKCKTWLLIPHGVALVRAADLEGALRTGKKKRRRRPR